MAEYLKVWRARFPEGSVEGLLDPRSGTIAEAQRLCPELVGDATQVGRGEIVVEAE